MPVEIRIEEKPTSQRLSESLSKKSVEIHYQAKGIRVTLADAAPTREEVEAAVISQVPQFIGTTITLFRSSVTAEEVDYLNWVWDVVVVYELPDWQAKQTGDSIFAFDTTGGTQHIVHSKVGVVFPPTAPDAQGMIGPTADDVTGCDITVPQFGFTATLYIKASDLTQAYIADLYDLTGKVNIATFNAVIDGVTLQFNDHEVLFLGAQGQKRGAGDVELTFHFAASPNVTGLTVGPITGINKFGWEFLSVRTVRQVVGSGSNAVVTMVPQAVYIDKVYNAGDFSKLKLPTAPYNRIAGF